MNWREGVCVWGGVKKRDKNMLAENLAQRFAVLGFELMTLQSGIQCLNHLTTSSISKC